MFIPQEGDNMDKFMGVNVKPLLKKCGKDVMIYPLAKVVNPHLVEIGDHSRLCDFTFIHPGTGKGYKIGRYTDIEQFSSLWGGGEILIGDFVNVGPGVTFFSSKFDYRDGGFLSSVVPEQYLNIEYGSIIVGNHAFIGTNSTIMVGVHIGEGAVVGANSFVNKDLEAWSVYVGNPLRKIGERPRDVLEKAKKLGLA
jgi:acetyltransferase-like isoleucine patch superfamily enzyme